ncbi:MAG: DUF1501 domain-containing protein [Phycisphaeraceae bacterium]|nr:DUF1501 domain-containing protein [Phycisphaeraceae bacterium]
MYGPSVFPYQPEGLWIMIYSGDRWNQSTGEDAHRRSLYTFIRRTVPHPAMTTFDAPSREVCISRRIRTNTPLQAMVTLNDPQFVEASQGLARLAIRAHVDDASRAAFIMQRVLCRPPTADELAAMLHSLAFLRTRYADSPDDALAAATEPLGPLDPAIPPSEAASMLERSRVRHPQPRRSPHQRVTPRAIQPLQTRPETLTLLRPDSPKHATSHAATSSAAQERRRPHRARIAPRQHISRERLDRLARAVAGRPLHLTHPHFGESKRVIYMHMSGSPPQQDLFDYKPRLNELDGQLCPDSLLEKERFAFIKGHPKILGSPYRFARVGKSGMWCSQLLPSFASIADEVTLIRSMHTDQFNHAPAELFLYTGSPRLGRPSIGSWAVYGLGSENQNLPGFVVLLSGRLKSSSGKSVWGSGFLPSVYQGCQCRSEGEPILYVNNPKGVDRPTRREALDLLGHLNPSTPRIAQRPRDTQPRRAVRTRLPHAGLRPRSDGHLSRTKPHPQHVRCRSRGSQLRSKLRPRPTHARTGRPLRPTLRPRLGCPRHTPRRRHHHPTADQVPTDRSGSRRPRARPQATRHARGHAGRMVRRVRPHRHERRTRRLKVPGTRPPPHCFTIWMAGAGLKRGYVHGETDELGYRITLRDPVHIHDLQATMLHALGLNHEKLTYRFQGRDFRLTDVHGRVVHELFA